MADLQGTQASHLQSLVKGFGVGNGLSVYRDNRATRALGDMDYNKPNDPLAHSTAFSKVQRYPKDPRVLYKSYNTYIEQNPQIQR